MTLLSYRKPTLLALGAFIAGCAFAAAPAQAQFFQNTTGLSNPGTTITFDEVPLATNTPVTNQYAAFGVTFEGLFYNPQPITAPNQVPPQLGNFTFNGDLVPTFSIFFNTAQTSAAFSLITNAGTSTFTALNNGTVVFSANAPTGSAANDYYGFTGITFDQINVAVGGFNNSGLIDNLQVGTAAAAVPEPSQYAMGGMLGASLLFGMVKARRRTSKKATETA